MPRPIDPERHRARRLQIIDAGLTVFASHGYAGATTALICRTAGIGSGTFFHYFPTKADLLAAIIEWGTAETREFFAAQEGRADARQVLFDFVRHATAELEDERAAGFVRAVGGQVGDTGVAAALEADDRAVRLGLRTWVERAQGDGGVRTDLPADRLVEWIVLLLDGFASLVAGRSGFEAAREAPMLLEQTERLLAPTR
ncbi:TetR family transcriptional regulator [Streptomonospora alba]|uniref:TetR family transcriptional regulator n=1 Tax=Streptomonospora alba TaxID=183763 RepID=A0A0C2JGK8_9ACTN|nr:TetR/AcrR family transcriptional regulator [Streptomonospora alba]KIH98050.1 TetR family transcriptional regulator [Streptomonospora alba]